MIAPPRRELGRSDSRGGGGRAPAAVLPGPVVRARPGVSLLGAPCSARRSRGGPRSVGNLWQRLARHLAELGGHHARPGALVRRRREALARLLGDPLGELSEQVVGDQRPALGRDPGLGSERVEGGQRPRPNGRPVDRQQTRDVVVAATALQHEVEDRALVGWQRVERVQCETPQLVA